MRILYNFVTVFLLVAVPCEATSRRIIYTLFTDRKTWNEAKAICESQFGQLVKLKSQSQMEEIMYLDVMKWENRAANEFLASGVWVAAHMPFMNNTVTYQDCEPLSAEFPVSVSGTPGKCFIVELGNIRNTVCNEERMFACQRDEGDCWYEPFFEEEPNIFLTSAFPKSNVDPQTCALECRNFFNAIDRSECWGFTFYPAMDMCMLHVDNSPSASINYLKSANRKIGPEDSTFYVRRCFEGVLDTELYDDFQNMNPEPESDCATKHYRANNTDFDACYCSTKDYPPIPAPISSEEKAKYYEKDLAINHANTSVANRKLTSAEDNRPSVISVGYVGVGLLSAVFGGIFLLDLNVLLTGIKKTLCTSA